MSELAERSKIAVLTLNWNRADVTLSCLEAIGVHPSIDIFVVDNGSSDDSVNRITESRPDCRVLRNHKNLGFARGNNVGLRHILELDTYDVIVVLNNDALITAEVGLRGAEMVRKDKSIGMVTGKTLTHDNCIWYGGGTLRRFRGAVKIRAAGEPDVGQVDRPQDVSFLSLAFAVMRAELVSSVGLFAEEYFFGQEEWDYSLRVRRAGYRLVYEPSLVCIHGGDGSHRNTAPEFVYNGYRNKLIFQNRYLPPPLFAVWRMIFSTYARTVQPLVCQLIRQNDLDRALLRYCATEALRDHAPGRAIHEEDLLGFRERVARYVESHEP